MFKEDKYVVVAQLKDETEWPDGNYLCYDYSGRNVFLGSKMQANRLKCEMESFHDHIEYKVCKLVVEE